MVLKIYIQVKDLQEDRFIGKERKNEILSDREILSTEKIQFKILLKGFGIEI